MVKVIIEMDGKKVFEQESEFAHVLVGTRDEGDKGYNQISGLVGTIKNPAYFPGMAVKGMSQVMKEACEGDKKAYLLLLSSARMRLDEILEEEVASNGAAAKDALLAAIMTGLEKGDKNSDGGEH